MSSRKIKQKTRTGRKRDRKPSPPTEKRKRASPSKRDWEWRENRQEELAEMDTEELIEILKSHETEENSEKIDELIRNKGKGDFIKEIVDIESGVFVVPGTRQFDIPRPPRKGKDKFSILEWIWKSKRETELEDLSLEELQDMMRNFQKTFKGKGHEKVLKRIDILIKGSDKRETIKAVANFELQDFKLKKRKKTLTAKDLGIDDITVEKGIEFQLKKKKVPDQEIARLFGEPLTEDINVIGELVGVPYETHELNPYVKLREATDYYRMKKAPFGMLLIAKSGRPTRFITSEEEFKLDLEDKTLSDIVSIFVARELPFDKHLETEADYIETLLKYEDLQDPENRRAVLQDKLNHLIEDEENEDEDNTRREGGTFEGEDIAPIQSTKEKLEALLELEDLQDPKNQKRQLEERYVALEGKKDKESKKERTNLKKKIADMEALIKENKDAFLQAKKALRDELKAIIISITKPNQSFEDAKKSFEGKIKKILIDKIVNEEIRLDKIKKVVPPPETKKDIKNPFDKRFKKYTRVSFVTPQGENQEGVVMGFTERGVEVSVAMGDRTVKVYKILYTNPSLKVVKKIEADLDSPKFMSFEDSENANDMLLGNVTEELRKLIVETYITLLKEIREVGDLSPEDSLFATYTIGKLTKEEFYENRYKKFKLDYFRSHQNLKKLRKELEPEAERLAKEDVDEDGLSLKLISLVNNFSSETTAMDFLNALKSKGNFTNLEIFFLKNLERGSPDKVYGDELVAVIAKSVKQYIATVPKDKEAILGALVELKLEEMSQLVDDNEEMYRGLFEDELEEAGDDEYDSYLENYKSMKVHSVKKKTKLELSVIEIIENQVSRFEEIAFETSKNVRTYLKRALIPYLFMQGSLASLAKFFRAKLANGDFDFGVLNSANLAHYLPEFAMSGNDEQFEVAGEVINQLLNIQIEGTLDFYLGWLNPTKRKANTKNFERASEIAEPLKNMTTVGGVGSTCNQQTGTGQRQVVKNGKYVYTYVGSGANRKKIKVMEDIPEDDMVICYDDKSKKFSCHDINEILVELKKTKNPVNPSTGKPYPKSFIEKIKKFGRDVKVPEEPVFEGEVIQKVEPKPFSPVIERVRIISTPRHKVSHKRIKEGKFKKIKQMLLLGDDLDIISLFSETLYVPLETGKVYEVPITYKTKSKRLNVAVISFDASTEDPVFLKKLASNVKKVPKDVDIYLIGVGPVSDALYFEGLIYDQKWYSTDRIRFIFFTENNTEEDVLHALINVAIDVEGPTLKVLEPAKQEEWAYRYESPKQKRKVVKKVTFKEDEKEVGYQTMTIKDLKFECAKRKIDCPETKNEIIRALEDYDNYEEPLRKDYNKMNLKQLQRECEKRGITCATETADEVYPWGKTEIIVALKDYDEYEEPEDEGDTEGEEPIKFSAAEKKRWKSIMSKKPKYSEFDKMVASLTYKPTGAGKEDPLLDAALHGDTTTLKKLIKTSTAEEVVEVYREVASSGGAKDVLKILRTDPRVRDAALDGDLEILEYIAESADEHNNLPTELYKDAKKRKASTDVTGFLWNYQSVRDMQRIRQSEMKNKRRFLRIKTQEETEFVE